MKDFDPENIERVAGIFGIAESMAREIVFMNDDDWGYSKETPEARFARMRAWVAKQIREPKLAEAAQP